MSSTQNLGLSKEHSTSTEGRQPSNEERRHRMWIERYSSRKRRTRLLPMVEARRCFLPSSGLDACLAAIINHFKLSLPPLFG